MRRDHLCAWLITVCCTGCDIFGGPSPLNDAPFIESAGEVRFTDAKGNTLLTRGDLALSPGETLDLEIVATEPEGEALTLAVGPIPRGWSYDEDTQVLHVTPDAEQRDLTFEIYLCAEDAHDPPAYDVRILSVSVW
ncbi:MAG: hypothetical protein ABIJ09_13500 [Pseudomonadota bacterium]